MRHYSPVMLFLLLGRPDCIQSRHPRLNLAWILEWRSKLPTRNQITKPLRRTTRKKQNALM